MKMRTLETGKTDSLIQRGFSLLELLIVLAIVAGVVATSVPQMSKLYDSMKYRDAVRSAARALQSARYIAVSEGRSIDAKISVADKEINVEGKRFSLGSSEIGVTSSREVNQLSPNTDAAIRFFSDGSSSGGSIELKLSGRSSLVKVDWLLGKVSVE